MAWWPEGFRVRLLAFGRPASLMETPLDDAAHALLSALTEVPPAGWPFRREAGVPLGLRADLAPGGCKMLEGPFADPGLLFPCQGKDICSVAMMTRGPTRLTSRLKAVVLASFATAGASAHA